MRLLTNTPFVHLTLIISFKLFLRMRRYIDSVLRVTGDDFSEADSPHLMNFKLIPGQEEVNIAHILPAIHHLFLQRNF